MEYRKQVSDSDSICPRCQKPRSSSKPGSITQWVAICRCDSIVHEENRGESIEICTTCGKRIAEGRQGSLTQFIFRADTCSCRSPAASSSIAPGVPESSREHRIETNHLDEAPELEPDNEGFPIERYKAIDKLGSGGGGTVYLAIDRLLGKKVAVKMLRSLSDDSLVAFQDEARATSKLSHPGIVAILDFGATESGVPYMVLEHINGTNLDHFLARDGPMDWRLVVHVFSRLANALQHAHENGIFHRDLKPSNIILVETDDHWPDVKVIDFGVARSKHENQEPTVVQGRTVVGTPAYMSPDQIGGGEYDSRSEIYSLGCVLFEILTGHPPFAGETALATLSMHARERPPDLLEIREDCPAALDLIVSRCLEKKAADRFQSMSELEDQLEELKELKDEPLKEAGMAQREIGDSGSRVALLSVLLLASIIILSMVVASLTGPGLNGSIESSNNIEETRKPTGKSSRRAGRPKSGEWTIVEDEKRRFYDYRGEALRLEDITDLDNREVERVRVFTCKRITRNAMAAIGSFPNLEYLSLRRSNVRERGMRLFANAVRSNGKFEYLSILDCELKHGVLKHVSSIPSLNAVHLRCSKFSIDKLRELRSNSIERLEISYNNLDSGSLDILADQLPSLERLIVGRSRFSSEELERFKRRMPACKIKLVAEIEEFRDQWEKSNPSPELMDLFSGSN